MYPSEGNISGEKNFKRPAILLMDIFDESFLVRVPRGRARHRPLKHANFTPVLPRCQARPPKFTFVIICNRERIEGPLCAANSASRR